MRTERDPIAMQRAYYRDTADDYDRLHGTVEGEEHSFALSIICGLLSEMRATSVLDTGCGTAMS